MEEFNNIVPEDIVFQNNDICIINPNIPKGIIISHKYRGNFNNIMIEGLKSGAQLKKENIPCLTNSLHRCIFFRAPYHKPRKMDYSSIETEILNLYSESKTDINMNDISKLDADYIKSHIFIRIDPRKTFVYSSELRDIFSYPELYGKNKYINNSRKNMIEYLEIIENNRKEIILHQNMIPYFNLITSKVNFTTYSESKFTTTLPHSPYLINKCSEVLVELPIISPNFFVET